MTSEDYLDAFEKLLRFVVSHLCSVTERRKWYIDYFGISQESSCKVDINKPFICYVWRMGLKDKQEREIVHVLMDCCLQEKTFNAYYAVLGEKFCSQDRRFQVKPTPLWLRHTATVRLGMVICKYLKFLSREQEMIKTTVCCKHVIVTIADVSKIELKTINRLVDWNKTNQQTCQNCYFIIILHTIIIWF